MPILVSFFQLQKSREEKITGLVANEIDSNSVQSHVYPNSRRSFSDDEKIESLNNPKSNRKSDRVGVVNPGVGEVDTRMNVPSHPCSGSYKLALPFCYLYNSNRSSTVLNVRISSHISSVIMLGTCKQSLIQADMIVVVDGIFMTKPIRFTLVVMTQSKQLTELRKNAEFFLLKAEF